MKTLAFVVMCLLACGPGHERAAVSNSGPGQYSLGCVGADCNKKNGCGTSTTVACYSCCTNSCQACATDCQDTCDGLARLPAGVGPNDYKPLVGWLSTTDFFGGPEVTLDQANTISYLYLASEDDRIIRWAVALASDALYRERSLAVEVIEPVVYEELRTVLLMAITDTRSEKIRFAAAKAVRESGLIRHDVEAIRTVLEQSIRDDSERVSARLLESLTW